MSDDEDYYYYDDDDDSADQEEDQDADCVDEEIPYTKPVLVLAKSLDEQDLVQCMNEVIHSVSSLLSLPPDACSILLRNFRWDVHKLQDSWFSDQSQACQSAGLLVPTETTTLPTPSNKKPKLGLYCCPICFNCHVCSSLRSAACGHMFCKFCWNKYITNAINDGRLTLRCPDPGCSVSIDEALINEFADKVAKAKFTRFLVNNFVECSKAIKWCPAPGCEYAVQFTGFKGQEDVSCKCTYTFCWDCVGEPHRPVDCETALKWHEKNNSDSLNTEWILFNSKPCPKCRRPIEKNQGCNHMTCHDPCRHKFCWVCMAPWHGYGTACNVYPKKSGNNENLWEAKKSFEKYTHFYERWMNNDKSRLKAIESLERFKEVTMVDLFELYGETNAEMENSFIRGWKQIIECRRVLKWTYAYGYYLPDEKKPKTLFEDLQGQAEAALERLHYCLEKELSPYLEVKSKEFFMYKLKVIELTNTTRNFFNNLVHGLETGLF